MKTLQTLERGLQALEVIASQQGKLTVAKLALALDLNRTITYRIVKTLQAQGYVEHDSSDGLYVGAKILHLYEQFEQKLPHNSQTLLDQLSIQTNASTAMVMADRQECVVVKTAALNSTVLQVSYRLGTRHPMGLAAAGVAVMSTFAPQADDPAEVVEARRLGYAYSQNVLQQGAIGLFVPLAHRHMAIGLVTMSAIEVEALLPLLQETARRLI
ncbi:MAG: helix-turn-helix domain-containing protein [Neisseriaceae bacterium]|nr:helix-turn-helix domain-containing protein [Neisseriaceae bacterium]MBP6862753.1 helix-turn-helix domain-containing protein [Neisseriaceae bacterium]